VKPSDLMYVRPGYVGVYRGGGLAVVHSDICVFCRNATGGGTSIRPDYFGPE
jgi:hypothetical protein